MSAKSSQSSCRSPADPYPRKHGVKLEDVLPKPRKEGRQGRHEQRRHPFAGLAALQRQAAPRPLNCCGGVTFWLEKSARRA